MSTATEPRDKTRGWQYEVDGCLTVDCEVTFGFSERGEDGTREPILKSVYATCLWVTAGFHIPTLFFHRADEKSDDRKATWAQIDKAMREEFMKTDTLTRWAYQ